uniref:Uncharacterized protein n=1 Tax=Arundo donax TaxID=35708 RepID=A0A0A9B1P1_ARUDO
MTAGTVAKTPMLSQCPPTSNEEQPIATFCLEYSMVGLGPQKADCLPSLSELVKGNSSSPLQ